MLNVFIDCDCFQLYSGLGDGTPDEQFEAWQDVISEYAGLMKNGDSDYLLELMFKELALKQHLFFVENAVFTLERVFNQELIDKLIYEFGYDGDYPEHDREAYLKQLGRVLSLSKTKAFELSEIQDELRRNQKESTGGKRTKEDWESDLARLSKYQGYHINKFETSVLTYTQIHNNYIQEMTALKPPN